MTQHEMILSYMEEYGSITPMECFMHLGITKLSTRIGEMRRGGLDIRQAMETGKNRQGQETRSCCRKSRRSRSGRERGRVSRNKYHNKKTMRIIDGKPVEFASKKEAKRYGDLRLLERAGRIRSLERQHDFVLLPTQRNAKGEILEHAVRYRADFTYYEYDDKTGKWRYVVEDVKGMRTSTYLIKRKLMLKEHGIRIREV